MTLNSAFYVIEGVVRPISKITETMRSVAGGNLECASLGVSRGVGPKDLAVNVPRESP